MDESKIGPQIFAALSGTFILLASGYHMGWSSPELPKILADESIPVTSSQGSWIVVILLLGCATGPLLGIGLVDRWGRKTVLLVMSILFALSCILIAFAQNYWWFYLARFVAGLGIGAIYMVIPMYLGEISENKIRGSFGVLFCVMLNVGNLLPCCTGPWVSRQVVAAIGVTIPIIYVLLFVWSPETPYFYLMKRDSNRARRALAWLRGISRVDEELNVIKDNVDSDLRTAISMKELFVNRGNRKALFLTLGILSAQQLSGQIAITSYSTMIFNEVTSAIDASFSVIIIGVVQLLVSIVIIFLVDRVGRRPLMLCSMSLCSIFLIGEALYFHLRNMNYDVSNISWLPLTAMIGYLCSYQIGIGTVPMAFMSEVFACNIKAYATMIGAIHISFAAALATKLYQIVSDAYGIHVAFYGFAFTSALSAIFIFIFIFETKGRSFPDIQDELHGRRSESMEKH